MYYNLSTLKRTPCILGENALFLARFGAPGPHFKEDVMKYALICGAILATSVLLGSNARAATAFPQKEITIIVPYSTGGESDMTARKIAEIADKLQIFSQPIVVVNMPSANTRDALRHVAASKPDGHTLLLHHTAFLGTYFLGTVPYSYKDFAMIGQSLITPNCIIARADAPWKNGTELLAAAAQSDKPIVAGTSSVGGYGHTIFEFFMNATKSRDKFKIIFFGSTPETSTALLGGKIDIRIQPTGGAMNAIKAGDSKILILLTEKGMPQFPGVETLGSLGITNIHIQRQGLWAPKDTPPAVLDQLGAALEKIVNSPEFQEFAAGKAMIAEFIPRDQWLKYYQADEKVYDQIAAGIKKAAKK